VESTFVQQVRLVSGWNNEAARIVSSVAHNVLEFRAIYCVGDLGKAGKRASSVFETPTVIFINVRSTTVNVTYRAHFHPRLINPL